MDHNLAIFIFRDSASILQGVFQILGIIWVGCYWFLDFFINKRFPPNPEAPLTSHIVKSVVFTVRFLKLICAVFPPSGVRSSQNIFKPSPKKDKFWIILCFTNFVDWESNLSSSGFLATCFICPSSSPALRAWHAAGRPMPRVYLDLSQQICGCFSLRNCIAACRLEVLLKLIQASYRGLGLLREQRECRFIFLCAWTGRLDSWGLLTFSLYSIILPWTSSTLHHGSCPSPSCFWTWFSILLLCCSCLSWCALFACSCPRSIAWVARISR